MLAPPPTIRPAARPIAFGAVATILVGAMVPVTGLLQDYPVLTGQAIRYGLAAAALFVWLRISHVSVPLPSRRDLIALVGLAATGMVGFNVVVLGALRYAEPGFVAALVGAAPLVIALVAPIVGGRRPRPAAVVGALIVVAGVAVLTGGGTWRGPGLVLGLLALVGEACFTLLAVGVVARLGAIAVPFWSCLIASVGGAALGSLMEASAAWQLPTPTEAVALLILAVVVTTVGFVCWYRCVTGIGAARAAVLLGLVPVSGLVVSVLLGGEQMTLASAVGVVVVGVGCAFGLRQSPQRHTADEEPVHA